MTDNLEFTGERFTPECTREIWYEHYHRYAWATQFCAGKSVLDAACGEGYGAALLARLATSVIGVDQSGKAIEHARQRYVDIKGLQFEQGDCTRLPFEDHQFDRVVSFETLEHLQEQGAMLAEFRRVLRPEGVLLLSSPDKAEYSDRQGFDNEFHVRELYREELEALLTPVFPAFRLLGQKLAFHSLVWDERGAGTQLTAQTLMSDGSLHQGSPQQAPVYLIALCAAEEAQLPDIDDHLWLFDDQQELVYQHYHHEIRKNMAAGALLAESEQEIQELRDLLEKANRSWWRRWLNRG